MQSSIEYKDRKPSIVLGAESGAEAYALDHLMHGTTDLFRGWLEIDAEGHVTARFERASKEPGFSQWVTSTVKAGA